MNPWLADVSCASVWGATLSPFSLVVEELSQIDNPELLNRFLESDAFMTARRRAQSARRAEGLGQWNSWARAMRDRRAAVGKGDLTFVALWNAVAKVRYDRESGMPGPFSFGALFSNVDMPADFELHGTVIDQYADFDNFSVGGKLILDDVVFAAASSWTQASFRLGSEVVKTQFGGRADFGAARWGGDAVFVDDVFSGPVMFRAAVFGGANRFEKVRFSAGAGFHIARFQGPLAFRDCAFSGAVSFQQSRFVEPATLEGVTFDGPLHTDAAFTRLVERPSSEQNATMTGIERRTHRGGAA